MIHISEVSRQPIRTAWTMERLNAELTINLGMAINRATHNSYFSALNSYLTFCRLHSIDIEPTEQTLTLYLTFQCTYINPKSVNSYLSGITNQLESHFPNVRVAHKSTLVSRALQEEKQRFCNGYGYPIHYSLFSHIPFSTIVYIYLQRHFSPLTTTTAHTFAIFTIERGPVYLWELRCKVSPKTITASVCPLLASYLSPEKTSSPCATPIKPTLLTTTYSS